MYTHEDDWSCAYCIAAGIPGHERGSSLRRKAANYVRIMESKSHKRESQKLILNKAPGKLHEEEKVVATESQHTGSFKYDDDVNEAKKTMNGVGNSLEVGQEELAVAMTSDEDANSDDDKSGSISKSQTMASSSASTSSEEGSSTTKRKYSVITTELCDPASEGVDLTQSRKRRVRHQPVLYDPQLCPASQWQSDATFHFVTKSRPRRKDERLKIFSKDPATYICSFCKNNKSFALCCFCGCRVCFLKDDKVRHSALDFYGPNPFIYRKMKADSLRSNLLL